MSHEQMKGTYDLKGRIAYYAGDLDAVCAALEDFRLNELESNEHDGILRVLLLALESISNSLKKESEIL